MVISLIKLLPVLLHKDFDTDNKKKNILSRIQIYRERIRSRHALTKLSAEQLEDIGLTEKQAEIESKKPFWK